MSFKKNVAFAILSFKKKDCIDFFRLLGNFKL